VSEVSTPGQTGGGGPTVAELAAVLDRIAPPALAEPWDNVGVLVGDPESRPRWVAVTLDPAFALIPAVGRALGRAADPSTTGLVPNPGGGPLPEGHGLLVAHHPVPWRPLSRVLATDPAGQVVSECLRRGISLYAAHTSFDSAPGGLSHVLASLVGMASEGRMPIVPRGRHLKLVVFVPPDQSAAVRQALAGAGAGWIGNYSDTAFASPGRGYFLPREGADPFTGSPGVLEETAEERVETIVPAHLLDEAVRRMLEVHPYDEVAYDVYPLESHPSVTRPELLAGIGRIGDLPGDGLPLDEFTRHVERALGLAPGEARLLGGPATRTGLVGRVAVCPGAGGAHVRAVAAAGAHVYVTGDVGYHDAVGAAGLRLAVIDAGHLATERPFVGVMATLLRKEFRAQGIPLDIIEVPTPPAGLR